jgi:hypothetical protein
MKQYIHKEIGKEVRAISGYYSYVEEIQLDFRGRQVLSAVGIGVVDNSCCGVGGCYFIEVPGYIISGEHRTDMNGNMISEVDPIESDEERKAIKAELSKLYPSAQVNFT